MRSAKILFKNQEAGVLTQHDDASFSFNYQEEWFSNASKPSISLTLPKTEKSFQSDYLFPFFYNMLPEGSNKQVVCKLNRIDTEDHFGLLMFAAKFDSIGAVNVVEIEI